MRIPKASMTVLRQKMTNLHQGGVAGRHGDHVLRGVEVVVPDIDTGLQ